MCKDFSTFISNTIKIFFVSIYLFFANICCRKHEIEKQKHPKDPDAHEKENLLSLDELKTENDFDIEKDPISVKESKIMKN